MNSEPNSTPANNITLRDADQGDLDTIQAIYAHHVLNGLASFEETPPDTEEVTRRFTDIKDRGLPYLVALLDGRIEGYAYAAPYRLRSAYCHTIEDSIYIGPNSTGLGLGRMLLNELIERCTVLGYRQMVAVIGDSGNAPSITLHERLGFEQVANMPAVGFKFGRWVDSTIMQRALGDGDTTLPNDTATPSA